MQDSEPGVPGDTSSEDSWQNLKDTLDPKTFSQAWLATQARIIGLKVHCGLVILGAPNQGAYEPIAVWPDKSAVTPELVSAVEDILNVQPPATKISIVEDKHIIACPLVVNSQICGAVVFEFLDISSQQMQQVQQQLEWGVGWLEVNIRRNKFTSSDRLVFVLELVATSLHHDNFRSSATAVATELAGNLGCERVAIGFLRGRHSQLLALSHSASFAKKTNVIRNIEAVMDEAMDQHTTVVFPAPAEDALQITRAHEVLSRSQNDGAICSIPLTVGERLLGAVVLERSADQPFDTATVELCQHAASLLGPLLDVKRKDDRWIARKVAESGIQQLQNLFGRRHTGLKLAATLLLFSVIFFSVVDGEYEIVADARLEGTVQRSIAAPVAGYVVEEGARAGDVVMQGDILFALDDRDLRLERLRWVSQKLKSTREFNEATADHSRAKASVLGAQVEQAEAEIALLDEQLARTRITAPFDGFIVSGDLSQSLGSPVERGDILFQIAPLDSYRVILEVDERDIVEVVPGQTGRLALTSSPGNLLPILVEKITPISTPEEGRNYFRVEARLEGDLGQILRPGMEGVGRIYVEERKLIWIWTYKITHWVRMFMWSWWP